MSSGEDNCNENQKKHSWRELCNCSRVRVMVVVCVLSDDSCRCPACAKYVYWEHRDGGADDRNAKDGFVDILEDVDVCFTKRYMCRKAIVIATEATVNAGRVQANTKDFALLGQPPGGFLVEAGKVCLHGITRVRSKILHFTVWPESGPACSYYDDRLIRNLSVHLFELL